MKNVYLCGVEIDEGNGAQASAKLLSGQTKFAACPERKNHLGDSAREHNLKTNQKYLQTLLI